MALIFCKGKNHACQRSNRGGYSGKETNIMGDRNNPMFNNEGYSDPTAYEVLRKIECEENERFHRLLYTLFYLCELAGFEIEGRITLIDKRNGRVWK